MPHTPVQPQLRSAAPSSVLFLVLLCPLLLLLAGCSGDDGDAKKNAVSEGDVTALKGSLEELLEQVKKDGAEKSHAEDLEKIASLVEKAEGKEPAVAIKSLKQAEKLLKALADEQEKSADLVKKLAPTRAAAEEAKKRADAAKAAQNAPEEYKQATDALARATEEAAKKTTAGAAQARAQFERAKDLFDQAREASSQASSARRRADEEKKVMLEQKEKAKGADAEHKAANEWTVACQTEREAESQFSKNDFLSATETYKNAQAQFAEALSAVQRAEQEAEIAKKAEAERLANSLAPDAGATPPPVETPVPEVTTPKGAPKALPGGAGPATGGATGGTVPFPEGFDPSSELFKQELDEEDQAFLDENIARLCPSGKLEYDSVTGAVMVDYTVGADVQKDADLSGIPKREYITFKPPSPGPNQKNLSPEDRKKFSAFSFSGNTQGQILFPVPFKFYVRIEFNMNIQTMDAVGTFGGLFMFDKAKGGYMTEWAKTGTTRGFLNPKGGIPPKFLKSANEWFDKVNEIPVVYEWYMTGAKTGVLTNIYNNDETAAEKVDKLTVSIPTAAYQRGLVGFKWGRTKFAVKELHVMGILDKQAAVDALRKKLGVKKSTPAKKEAKPAPEKPDATKPKADPTLPDPGSE